MRAKNAVNRGTRLAASSTNITNSLEKPAFTYTRQLLQLLLVKKIHSISKIISKETRLEEKCALRGERENCALRAEREKEKRAGCNVESNTVEKQKKAMRSKTREQRGTIAQTPATIQSNQHCSTNNLHNPEVLMTSTSPRKVMIFLSSPGDLLWARNSCRRIVILISKTIVTAQ
jgi:hypothetical protein